MIVKTNPTMIKGERFQMRIFKQGAAWCADAKFGENGAKDAGFEWDAKRSLWWTSDVAKAWQLRDYADNSVKNAIHKEFLQQKRNGNGLAPHLSNGQDLSRATESDIDVPAPEGLRYLPYQLAGIEFALERQHTLIADEMGLGKAQPLDAKILTPSGWKTMGDMKVGTYVTGKDGKATEVIGVFPQGEKDVYEVTFTDGAKVRCCGDHLWTVNTPTRRHRKLPWFDLTTKQLIQTGLNYEATGKRKYHIPVVEPVQYRKQRKPLTVDPWLLGMILGASSHIRAEVLISITDETVKGRVEETLRRDYGDEVKLLPCEKNKETNRWRLTHGERRRGGNMIVDQLRALKVIGCKRDENFIPARYMKATVEERTELLRGLMDARGRANCGIRFTSSSDRLMEDISQLIRSLGGLATADADCANSLGIKMPTAMGDLFYTPSKAKQSEKRREPTRTIDKIEKVGRDECQCISVANDDGLYVTDHHVVTHNTIQAIGVVNATKAKRVLVICPASLKLNWKYELTKWTMGRPFVDIATGKHFPFSNVVIINYEILERHAEKLRKREWDVMIVDECHYLKNPKAKRTIQVLGKKSGRGATTPIPAKRVLFLSGTPMVNRPIELWPLIDAIAPGRIAKNWYDYVTRYCGAVSSSYGMKVTGASNLGELQQKLRGTIMIRRMKMDVLKDLPPKIRQVIELPAKVDMDGALQEERNAYADAQYSANQLRIQVEIAKTSGDRVAYETAIQKMRKETGLTLARIAKARKAVAIAKIPDVIDRIRGILNEGAKLVVFAHHLEVIDKICASLPAGSWVKLDGRDSTTKRDGSVRRFQTDDDCRVFVGGMKAAGVGLTLTASSHVLFTELDWVPGTMTQAEDRCHRIGQKDSVLVQHMVVEGSIDVNMAKTIIAKQDVLDRALDRATFAPTESASILKSASSMRDIDFEQFNEEAEKMDFSDAQRWGRFLKYITEKGCTMSEIDTEVSKHLLEVSGMLTPRQGVAARVLCEAYGPEGLVRRMHAKSQQGVWQ